MAWALPASHFLPPVGALGLSGCGRRDAQSDPRPEQKLEEGTGGAESPGPAHHLSPRPPAPAPTRPRATHTSEDPLFPSDSVRGPGPAQAPTSLQDPPSPPGPGPPSRTQMRRQMWQRLRRGSTSSNPSSVAPQLRDLGPSPLAASVSSSVQRGGKTSLRCSEQPVICGWQGAQHIVSLGEHQSHFLCSPQAWKTESGRSRRRGQEG